MYEIVFIGALGGVAWATLGTVRDKTKAREPKEAPFAFNKLKFLKSVFVGAGVGGYLGFVGTEVSGSTIESALQETAVVTPIVAVCEKFATLIYDVVQQLWKKK